MNYAEIVRQKISEGYKTCKEIAHSIGMDYNSKSYPALKSAFGRFKNGEQLKEKVEKPVEVPKTTSELIAIDFGKRAESAKVKELNAKYNHLLAEYENSEKRFDALINIKQPVEITRIEPYLSESKNEAAANTLAERIIEDIKNHNWMIGAYLMAIKRFAEMRDISKDISAKN